MYKGDLVYKLRRIRYAANFISSGSKIVKLLRRRRYDSVIIEMVSLALSSFIEISRSFL